MKVLNEKELATVFGGNFYVTCFPSENSIHVPSSWEDARNAAKQIAGKKDTLYAVYEDRFNPKNIRLTTDGAVQMVTQKGTVKLKSYSLIK